MREDSRVLLERCDRLCVVEVMSGVYHGSEFPSCARSVRPAGVIHSVPGINKTKKQRINKETRSPLGEPDQRSRWYSVKMLTRGLGKCRSHFVYRRSCFRLYLRPSGRFRKDPAKVASNVIQLYR